MSNLHSLLICLGMLLPADNVAPPTSRDDPARLREMLLDRKHPRDQDLAALLLVQSRAPEAEDIVRQGLRQTDEPEVFLSLAVALRLEKDNRFSEELLEALVNGRPAVRAAAGETLAQLSDGPVLLRLRAVAEDGRLEIPPRHEALAAIGKCGKRAAIPILLDQLENTEEPLRRVAIDALTDLTGQTFGQDAARWRHWWSKNKDRSTEQWLEERLAFQVSRAQRLENELERTKAQLVQLHQQLYQKLPAADRLAHVQTLADTDDPTVRSLVVSWCAELWPQADAVGQRTLAGVLLHLANDGNVAVQRPAVLALGRVADDRTYEQLRRLLTRGKAPVRAAAAHALTEQSLARAPGTDENPDGGPRFPERLRQVVPLLQKALDDPALEVVVAAAEDLGALGVPEAGPVLAVLLRHPHEPVRQAAAQALERVADPKVLDGVLRALDDSAITVRFSLVGALGRVATEAQGITDAQRARMLTRLEDLLLRDPDAGVRSRAARVIGQTGAQVELPFLWRRLQAREDARVQEKTWGAMVEILGRSNNPVLVRQWDRTLADAGQGNKRLEMLAEVLERWKKADTTRQLVSGLTEMLVQAQLDQGKWSAAYPLIRDLLDRPGEGIDLDRRLGWLLKVGERALLEGNKSETLRVVHEAQAFLPRSNGLAGDFERLERRAKEK